MKHSTASCEANIYADCESYFQVRGLKNHSRRFGVQSDCELKQVYQSRNTAQDGKYNHGQSQKSPLSSYLGFQWHCACSNTGVDPFKKLGQRVLTVNISLGQVCVVKGFHKKRSPPPGSLLKTESIAQDRLLSWFPINQFSLSLPVTFFYFHLFFPFNSRNAVINFQSVKRNLYLSDLQTGNNLGVLPKVIPQPTLSFSSPPWATAASCCCDGCALMNLSNNFFFFLNIYLFIYLWLCWDFVSV